MPAPIASAIYEYEPTRRDPRGSAAAQHLRSDLPGAAGKRCIRAGRAMSAMDNATRNAGEMIDKLTISYNRQRQAQITKELIEIISGAEAL
jgi:ATP synthase F1 gamma subunit